MGLLKYTHSKMFHFVWFGSDLEIAIFIHDECLVRNCLAIVKYLAPGFHMYVLIQLLSTRTAN